MIYSKPEAMSMVLDHCPEGALACALIHSLSQWIPSVVNFSDGEQSTYGLFQFTGQQARQAGYKGNFPDLIDARLNIEVGAEILKQAVGQAGNKLDTALLVFLGRSRAQMIPGIVALIPAYQELIAQRR